MKKDGDMALVPDEKTGPGGQENRKKFLEKYGIEAKNIAGCKLSHGAKIAVAKNKDKGKFFDGADGIISNEKNLFLEITTADCYPVFLRDEKTGSFGIVHAGWRGLEKEVVKWAVVALETVFEAKPRDISAYIGPGISAKNYEVKNDTAKKFSKWPEALAKKNKKIFLNLEKIIEEQLEDAGIKGENIKKSGECTYDLKNKYFSARRDKPEKIQAMLSFIGIKK